MYTSPTFIHSYLDTHKFDNRPLSKAQSSPSKTNMSPSSTFATILALSTALVGASPVYSGSIDTSMPVLPDATSWVQSATVWWTPDATQSEWDWKTWSQSSTSTIQYTPEATTTTTATPQASSWVPYSNPFTIYTTMTNSLGVITGMPAVDTSQPSMAPKATECSGCASVESAQESWSKMVSSLYSTATPVVVAVNATSSKSTSTASATSSGFSQDTNAASRSDIFNSGAALAVFGLAAYLL